MMLFVRSNVGACKVFGLGSLVLAVLILSSVVNANTLKASEASQALANMGDAIAGKDEMEAKLLNGLSSRSGKTTDVSTNMGSISSRLVG